MNLLGKRMRRRLALTAAVLAGCANPCFADGWWFPWTSRCGGPTNTNNTSFAQDSAHNRPSGNYRPPPPGGTWWPYIDNCATITKGAIPQPYGWFVHQWQNAHAAKAEADDFVIYKHEWFKGGLVLGPYGYYHLQQICKRLPSVPFPVLLEAETMDPSRNEMRRNIIVGLLAQTGYVDPGSRVFIGLPEWGGLYGDEAPRIFQQMLTRQNPYNMMFGQGGFGGGFGGLGGLNTVPGGGTYGGFGGAPVAVPQNLP
jgi:hypothetical protein